MLIFLENVLHSQKFISFFCMNIKYKSINTDHLLVKPKCCFPYLYSSIFEPSYDCREQIHIHIARNQILFCKFSENLHDFDSAQSRLVMESFEQQLQKFVLCLLVNHRSLLHGLNIYIALSLNYIRCSQNINYGIGQNLDKTLP